ncbi:serine/threonine-protein kinase [Paludisphaera rhizosphaerae]|uniref:serine/threonine-protein kinase n=1 Tax=Paludisphaera rhizosphaerae TaxID=2711216 RepID=UPI001F0D1C2E|nr:serine/threonine-protein kinase [Paludisphaera rhizosphaerae]
MIHCPSCRHPIRIVDVLPGRFTPKCPSCHQAFALTIPEAEGNAPSVEMLKASPPPAEASEPSLEAIPTNLDAATLEPGYSRLPRGTPRFLANCLVLKLLGHGPRGKSLLARPLSLAGRVVLKVIAADRGRDAIFVERFLREALATAQLSSPHLIPIVDIGRDGSSTFTAMEYVPGASLAEELARRGKIEPRLAAAWILQAARGLSVAHEQGIWHRDIKPENLRVTPDGLVVVDDLGLETTPSLAAAESARDAAGSKGPRGKGRTVAEDAPTTRSVARVTAGSPVYMAPEQARHALIIDGRADVYSLGCTFYQLVAGRPPFVRPSATELIASHQADEVIPPQEFAPGIPPRISDVILTMVRKTPEERYPSMNVVVDVLENALGLPQGKTAAVEEEYRQAVREAAAQTIDSPSAKLRSRILMAAGGAWLAFLLLLLAMRAFRPLIVVGGFGLLTTGALAFALRSLRPSGLVDTLRHVFLGNGLRSWIASGVVAVLLLGMTIYGGFLGSLIFLGICVGALIAGFRHFVEKPYLADRDEAVARVKEPLKRLRDAGADEQRLRDALIATAGRGWEPLFAGVFGERALSAERLRALHDPTAPSGEGRRWWSGRLERLLTAVVEMRRDARLRRLFQDVEEARFEAEGVNLMTARRHSWRVSRALIAAAAEWRDEQVALRAGSLAPGATGPTISQHLRDAIEEPERVLAGREDGPGPLAQRLDSLSDRIFGRLPRLVLGAVLLAAFAYWMHTHKVVTLEQVGQAASQIGQAVKKSAENADPNALAETHVDVPNVDASQVAKPLGDDWVPGPFRSIFAANLGVAGLLLLLSAVYRSRGVGLAAYLAAAAVLFAPVIGLTSQSLAGTFAPATQAMLLGVVLLALGVVFGRR